MKKQLLGALTISILGALSINTLIIKEVALKTVVHAFTSI